MEILNNVIKYTVIAALFMLSKNLNSQISFANVYSGDGYDRGEGICQLSDSSYLVTGTSSSFEDAPSQAFLMRIDSTGNYMWSRAYGGSESETGRRVIAVEGYGYFVAGYSSSSGSGDFDNYLFFTDETGIKQWEVFTDNGGWERVNDAVLVESDTSVITVGQTDAGSDFVDDMLICRYTKTGTLMWKFTAGGSAGSDVANAVKMLSDTSFVVAGTSYVEDSLKNKAYLAVYHINGNLIWEKTYGENGIYSLNDVSVASGLFIKAVGESMKTGYSDYDKYALRVFHDGSVFGVDDNYVPQSVRVGCFVQYQPGLDGGHFLAEQTVNTNFPTFTGGEDVFIQKNSQDFNWSGYGSSYSGEGQDQLNQMIATSDGHAIAVGFNSSYGGGGNAVLIVKIGDDQSFPVFTTNPVVYDIVNLDENSPVENLSVYPNPVSDYLKINLENAAFSYVITDFFGREVTKGSNFGTAEIDFSAYAHGTYLLNVISGEKRAAVKVVR